MTVVTCHSCGTQPPAGAKFCGECGAKLAPADVPATEPVPSAPLSPASAAPTPALGRDEFRDVTVLFADVSGFTAMSERLDPEAVHRIMNACFDGLGQIIQRHGGHIDKYIGDSIMALFGAPTAHEDDSTRAAEAAIEMQIFLATFAKAHAREAGQTFKMRIGLNCGLVLAGAVGTEGRRDYSVMGDVVNIAARLEQMARPGSILASADFKQRVARSFAFGPAVTLQLKGKERATQAFELVEERLADATSDGAPDDRPFTGRVTEISELRDAIRIQDHRPRWIEIRGGLGIGKSRLVQQAFGGRADVTLVPIVARPATRLRPFALARRLLFAVHHHFAADSAALVDRTQFVAGIAPVSANLEPFLNALWYLAAPDALGLKTPDPDPLTFRRTVERGLKQLLSNIADYDHSIVLYLDAYDFGDEETRAFMERAWKRGGAVPPVIATLRSDESAAPQTTQTIRLGPLDGAAAARLVALLSAKEPLTRDIVSEIVARSDGIPLFIEELTRKVAEDRAAAATPGSATAAPQLALPSSLLGLMISRLDRLEPEERDALAQCAVQGVEFSMLIAERVHEARGGKPETLRRVLHSLERRSIVQSARSADDRWSFAQILMQNACYDSMLKRDRRALHSAVADSLMAASGGARGVSAELLSSHFELSERWLDAAAQNIRAGERAADIYANSDALARFQRALRALGELDSDTQETRHLAFSAHRNAGLVTLRIGQYGVLETHAHAMRDVASTGLERAEADRLAAQGLLHRGNADAAEHLLTAACDQAFAATAVQGAAGGHDTVTCHILYDLADVRMRQGAFASALDLIGRCRTLVGADCSEALQLDILEGRIAHTQGRFQDAVALYEIAHQRAARAGSLSEEALTSNYMGNAARDVGRYGDAETYFAKALAIWSRVGLAESIGGAHNNLANLAISRGDVATARDHYTRAQHAFDDIGNAAGQALALTNLAILDIETGMFADAVVKSAKASDQFAKSGNRVLFGLSTVIMGEALIEQDRLGDARAAFETVLAAYDEITHPLAIAGSRRGLGRVALAEGTISDAIADLETAHVLYEKLAREQEAARTELHLARALSKAGRLADAHARLTNARQRFAAIGAINDLEKAERLSL